jgi:hypothetical protein
MVVIILTLNLQQYRISDRPFNNIVDSKESSANTTLNRIN